MFNNNNNKINIIAGGQIFLASVISMSVLAFATAGSSDDPLTSKSYVDTQISKVLASIEGLENLDLESLEGLESLGELTSILERLEALENNANNNSADSDSSADNNSSDSNDSSDSSDSSDVSSVNGFVFEPVYAEIGQSLIGKEGTEIILRSGAGVAVIPEGVSNISDVTTGQDIANNSTIGTNHLVITSRDDGRGIKITSNAAWFLVKGDYEIID